MRNPAVMLVLGTIREMPLTEEHSLHLSQRSQSSFVAAHGARVRSARTSDTPRGLSLADAFFSRHLSILISDMAKFCFALTAILAAVLEVALAQNVVQLPPLESGTYCGCSKGPGRCIRGAQAQTDKCRYVDCPIYTCDAVQTNSPEAICIVKTAEKQLVATPAVTSATIFTFPCQKIAKTHTFLQFYSEIPSGKIVEYAEAARNDFIVQSAGGREETDPYVKLFISNVALVAKDPSRIDSVAQMAVQAEHLAKILHGNQDDPASLGLSLA